MEEMRKDALELAVQHLSKDAHNLETVLQWADKFYEWLTQDGEPHTVDPEMPHGKDMVSKAELKAMLPTLGSQFRRNRLLSVSEIVGYKQAINEMLQFIDTM